MSATSPGLAPRENKPQEVSINVESSRVSEPVSPGETKPEVLPDRASQAVDNTTATKEQPIRKTTTQPEVAPVNETPVDEREFSERASRRFQELANRTQAAEAKAQQAEEMLRRVVGQPFVPQAPSQEEMLAKQFKTYDPQVGYPTDPSEYVRFNEVRATLAARQESERVGDERQRAFEMDELIGAYPEVANDPQIQGAIAAEVSDAKKKGYRMTYKKAADKVYADLAKKFQKEAAKNTQQDIQEKNEAYVETTKGASPQRGEPLPDPSKMTLKEMEAWMKSNGQWDNR